MATTSQPAVVPQVAPFAAKPVLALAAAVAVVHCAATAFSSGFWFDEVYVLATGRNHLDWGSADQPPLTPALAALMDGVAPGSLFVLRLPAMVATAGAVVVAALIAHEIGCDRRAQVYVAAAQATALWATLAGHWLTPYALEPVQWMGLVWLLLRWQRLRADWLLAAAGVVVGVATLTKFQVALLCLALLTSMAVCGPREVFRRPMLWVGMVVALAIAAPTILWQHAHGWPQLQMTAIVAGEAQALSGGRSGIAIQLVLFAGLPAMALAGFGTWQLFRSQELRPYRYLGVAFAILYLVFVVSQGRPYYLAGLYAPLTAAGAMGLQRRREAGASPRGWLVWSAWATGTAVAIAVLVLSVTMARSDVGRDIADRTSQLYHALPPELRDRTAVFGESYVVAAFLDGFATEYDLPTAYSGNRGYGYFDQPPDDHDVVLYVGRDPAALRPYFRQTRQIGVVGDDLRAYLCTGLDVPWASVWPAIRSLTVS